MAMRRPSVITSIEMIPTRHEKRSRVTNITTLVGLSHSERG